MSRSDVNLLNSLSDYVQDVKPFHSKLKEFLTELQIEANTAFNPRLHVSIIDSVFISNVDALPEPELGYDVGGYDDTPYDSLEAITPYIVTDYVDDNYVEG